MKNVVMKEIANKVYRGLLMVVITYFLLELMILGMISFFVQVLESIKVVDVVTEGFLFCTS